MPSCPRSHALRGNEGPRRSASSESLTDATQSVAPLRSHAERGNEEILSSMRILPHSAEALPGPWTHREATVNGVRLHYVEAGEGPLVVLLHGFPEFWYTWRLQIPALARAGFRVL